jgi:hypothetical protein
MRSFLRRIYKTLIALVFRQSRMKNDFSYLTNSESQAGQESWVIHCLQEKNYGFYLEIGAYNSRRDSNTFILESVYLWKGVAVEIAEDRAQEYNRHRSNSCVCIDALNCNFTELLEQHKAPTHIDYLQIDIEPAKNSLRALKRIPFADYSFSCITFEHDLYQHPANLLIRWRARKFLKQQGYRVEVSNVRTTENEVFEDWFVPIESRGITSK